MEEPDPAKSCFEKGRWQRVCGTLYLEASYAPTVRLRTTNERRTHPGATATLQQLMDRLGEFPSAVGSVDEQTLIVPLQNSIEAPEQLADVLGATRMLGGLCRIIAYVATPGHIRHAGAAPYIAFGELDGSRSQRTEALRQAFSRARGVAVEIASDIRAAMWSKFVFITALSGVGALTRVPIGVIRSQPEPRRLLRQALEEICAVAVGNHVALPADTVARDELGRAP